MPRIRFDRFARRDLLKATVAAGALAATPPLVIPRLRPATAAPGTAPAGGDAAAAFRELGDLVARRMAALKVPGAALGVILDGEEFAAGFGVTNVDQPLPVEAGTLFQLGSIAKTYTATALMGLVEQGKLDLEAPVRTYLPEFRVADAATSDQVRLRHLVTHSAGWFGDLFADTGDGDDALARYVAAMADLPQLAPLGKYFGYNNAAVVAAGRVVEVVTGQPYEAAARELVLAPLGLAQSFFFAEEVVTEAFAVGHGPPEGDPAGDPVVLRPWAIPRAANPAGGLAASVSDLLRYARFHLGDGPADGERVLSADGLARMRGPLGPGGAFGSDLVDGVGVGWFLATVGGARVLFQGGGTNGQQAVLALVPERGFAVALLTNSESSDDLLDEATARALDRFLGLTRPVPAEVPIGPARLAAYAGAYGAPDGRGAIAEERDGALLLTRTAHGEPAGGASPLTPVGDDRFVSKDAGRVSYLDFARDNVGAVGWLRLGGRLLPRLP